MSFPPKRESGGFTYDRVAGIALYPMETVDLQTAFPFFGHNANSNP
jgi:hypothetical protein